MNNTYARLRYEAAYWAERTGLKKNKIDQQAGALTEEIKQILSASGGGPDFARKSGGLKITIVPPIGTAIIGLSFDMLWALALGLRGHEVQALYCGRGLPSCEFNGVGPGSVFDPNLQWAFTKASNAGLCDRCTGNINSIIDAVGLPAVTLGHYISSEQIKELRSLVASIPPEHIRSYVLDRIPVGDHAFSSTVRVTLRGTVDLDDPYEMSVYRRQLLSAMVMARAARSYLEKERPDRVVCIHGVYLTHGTLVDVCHDMGVSVIVYGIPYRNQTVMMCHNETYHKALVKEPNHLWENNVLTDAHRAALASYMGSKLSGGRDAVNYHPNPILDKKAVLEQIGLDPEKPTIALYTNVIWDAQIYYDFNAFENIFEWVFETIDYIATRPDLQLVIRVHPAETKAGFKTRQPFAEEIEARFPKLPPNVFLVRPESDISSYTLADLSCAALIYGTKMGLELVYRGLPVIVAGETFSRNKGFTYDVESRNEYFDLLDKIPNLAAPPPAWISRVETFAYYLFFQKMMDMPLAPGGAFRPVRDDGESYYNFKNLAEIAPGKCRNLDIICDGIVNGSPFIADLGSGTPE